MAITFHESTHAQSATVTKPNGVINGSLLLFSGLALAASPVAAPGGWTEVLTRSASTTHVSIFYRYITDAGSEPASYTFTGFFIGGLTRVQGVDSTDVVSGTPTGANASVGGIPAAALTLSQVTTERDGAALIAVGYHSRSTAYLTGLTEQWVDTGVLVTGAAIQDVAGPSGTRSVGTTNTTQTSSAVGVLAALNPAPEPEPTVIRITGTISVDLAISM